MEVKLDIFEGPLDLLLHLIQKLEIDIYDIPIAEITEQYLAYIHTMNSLELSVAGEYIVMAATLMAIKSKTLLPIEEVSEEDDLTWEEDPRDALMNQLLEYRKYKYAAKLLTEKAEERSLYFSKEPMNVDSFQEEVISLPKDQLSTADLFSAFHALLLRKKSEQPVEKTITADDSTIEEKMMLIEKRIANSKKGCTFESLFNVPTKKEIVTTFMALLELMKKGKVIVKQTHNYEAIELFPIQGD